MRRCRVVLLVMSFALLASPVFADEPTGALLPDLTFDRVDTNDRVWRLSDFAITEDGPAPATPRPVYLHFGFMSCAPCHELAARAGETFGDRVELAYAHLDDVELEAAEETLPQLWTRLYHFVEDTPAYQGFVGLRRGNTGLMRLLTGSEAAPCAILIRPDGGFRILVTPSQDEVGPAFAWLLDAAQ